MAKIIKILEKDEGFKEWYTGKHMSVYINALYIKNSESIPKADQPYNILDKNLRDGDKYSICYRYIETHVDMAEGTFMEAICNKNYTENECFYEDTLLAENKRK